MLSRTALALPSLVLLLGACRGVPDGAVRDDGSDPTHGTSEPAPERVRARLGAAEARAGLFDLRLDRAGQRLWLRLPPAGADGEIARFIHVVGLTRGLGSNPVGLDRGLLGPSRLVVLRRVGPRVVLEQPNLAFRADSADAAERRAAEESFASSILWSGPIAATEPDGALLVDFTPFLTSDVHGVAARLRERGEGVFEVDPERSAVDLDACLAFPDNVELEAVLTFAPKSAGGGDGAKPGREVRAVAPTPEAVTLVQHHSLVRLPDAGYAPRPHDPRMGAIALEHADYAAGLAEPLVRRLATRHRLRRVDPSDPRSPVAEPIVYFVDAGAPEPVRSALVEGASWWAEAFERAGFPGGFQVELLPPDAHPLDARRNVIQWVHRATRGWSYGRSVVDPRTGEILKGHVTLGSLRVRHDRRLFEGLLGADRTGTGGPDDPLELALARLRQLAAHEVGHTLGLVHNFAASTYDGRASVMDYPAPLVRLGVDGDLDPSAAYGVGVGSWDVHAIRLLYGELPPAEDPAAALAARIEEGLGRGHVFLTDADARPPGAAHPRASLWDNGADPVRELHEVLEVRRVALARFGPQCLAPGAPLGTLEEVLAPLYLHHRYQLEAATKLVAGLEYAHAVRGDGQAPATPVDGERQRRALAAVLGALEPAVLDVPESALRWLAPPPPGAGSVESRERFASHTAPAFDALGAAATAADLVVTGLLQRERAARLVDLHRRDPSLPSLEEVLAALVQRAFATARRSSPRTDELERGVQRVVVARLVALASDRAAAPAVRARVDAELRALLTGLLGPGAAGEPDLPLRAELAADVRRHLDRPRDAIAPPPAPADPPPGSPIGALGASALDGCCGP